MVQKVLFVCLGNICRSPIADAVFLQLVKEMGTAGQWVVDSAGVGGWHVGKSPDHRARKILKNHNVEYNGKARQLQEDDFRNFDYIFGMDEDNIADLQRQAPTESKAKILLLGEFDPQGERIIRDPYYDSGSEGFETCYQQCLRSCKAFLEQL